MRSEVRCAAAVVLGLALAPACSRSAATGPAAADTPLVFARGTIVWGDGPERSVDWSLEEINGFSAALTLKTVAADQVTTLSASRQSPDDRLWFVWGAVASGAPTVVFGGAAGDVDRVVVVDTEGNQVPLRLTPAPGQGWKYGVDQMPAAWSGSQRLDVVGLAGTREIAREPLTRVA